MKKGGKKARKRKEKMNVEKTSKKREFSREKRIFKP